MARRVLRLAMFLLIGAVLTVAAAWAMALFATTSQYDINYDPPPSGTRLSSGSRVPEGWVKGTHVRYWGSVLRYEMVTEMVWAGSTLGAMTDRQNRSMERVEVGWPMGCMEWLGESDVRVERGGAWNWRQGLTPPFRNERLALGAHRRLPLTPLWPGFAVSTVAFSVLIWMAVDGTMLVRRAGRRRRGECVRCRYPIGGADVCVECGGAVR